MSEEVYGTIPKYVLDELLNISNSALSTIKKLKSMKENKEVVQQEWEIVAFMFSYGNTELIVPKREKGLFTSGFDNYTKQELLDDKRYNIHSVKRLSDNEVFSVGDNFDGGFKITSFKIDKPNDMLYEMNNNGYYYSIARLRPVPKSTHPPLQNKDEFDEWDKFICDQNFSTIPFNVDDIQFKGTRVKELLSIFSDSLKKQNKDDDEYAGIPIEELIHIIHYWRNNNQLNYDKWKKTNHELQKLKSQDASIWTDELVLMIVDLAHHNGYHRFPQRCIDLFDEVKKQASGSGYKYPDWIKKHLASKQQPNTTKEEVRLWGQSNIPSRSPHGEHKYEGEANDPRNTPENKYTIEDLKKAFIEARYTNPIVGLKYDTFEDYQNSLNINNNEYI